MNPPEQSVRRRHVFFISGYDPKGDRYYHALYQAEALKQSDVNHMTIEVGPRLRSSDDSSTWSIGSNSPDQNYCETTYEFYRWDDIVRQDWTRSIWRFMQDLFFIYAGVLRNGLVSKIGNLSWKALVVLFYPLGFLISSLALSIGLALWTASTLNSAAIPEWMAATLGVLVLAFCIWLSIKLEKKLNTTWLVRIFSFVGKLGYGQVDALERRVDALASKIEQKIRSSENEAVDEILIVGFSVGSILAVSAMARALQAVQVGQHEAALKDTTIALLTLGHCFPMLALLPPAKNFRAELARVAQSAVLTWIDFSSPTDWGSFAMRDPLSTCEVFVPADKKYGPIMKSPRFHTAFTPATYANYKGNKRRIHMQYLMASELLSDYDYFAITAGSLNLKHRYTHQ